MMDTKCYKNNPTETELHSDDVMDKNNIPFTEIPVIHLTTHALTIPETHLKTYRHMPSISPEDN